MENVVSARCEKDVHLDETKDLRILVENMLDLRRVSTEVRDEVIATLGGIILERFTIVMLLDDDEGRYEKIMNECNIIDALNYAVCNIPGALEALHHVAREVVEEYKSA